MHGVLSVSGPTLEARMFFLPTTADEHSSPGTSLTSYASDMQHHPAAVLISS